MLNDFLFFFLNIENFVEFFELHMVINIAKDVMKL